MVETTITTTLLPGGKCRMASTCAGEFDSSYEPFDDASLPARVAGLAAELRERKTPGVVIRSGLRPDDWKRIWPELAFLSVERSCCAIETVVAS